MESLLADILIKALNENDIGDLIKNISLYLGYPVMLTDTDYNLIACYPESNQDDPLWDSIFQYGTTPPEFINKMHIDGTMEYGANQSSPFVLDWGFLEKYPRVILNLERNHKYYGYIAVLCENHSPELFEKLKSINTVLCVLLEQNFMDGLLADDYQSMFMNYLLSENDIKKGQLEKWESHLKRSLQEPYYIIYGSCNSKAQSAKNIEYIKEHIQRLYPDVLAVTKGRELILLFSSMSTSEMIDSIVKRIQALLSDYNMVFGISNQFFVLDKPYIYLQQAKYAWLRALEKNVNYMNYRECILYNMISSVYSTLPKQSYEHDSIEKIKAYDKQYKTEYMRTLIAYVESLFHAKDTIEMLHIHRNTLPHRLEMIEKIGDLDLKNPETCTVLMINHYMDLY